MKYGRNGRHLVSIVCCDERVGRDMDRSQPPLIYSYIAKKKKQHKKNVHVQMIWHYYNDYNQWWASCVVMCCVFDGTQTAGAGCRTTQEYSPV